MPWVPWISIEIENTSNKNAKSLHGNTKDSITRKISDLTRITSLTPETSELIDRLCSSVYRQATGLSAREKEIAALVTSSFIGCIH